MGSTQHPLHLTSIGHARPTAHHGATTTTTAKCHPAPRPSPTWPTTRTATLAGADPTDAAADRRRSAEERPHRPAIYRARDASPTASPAVRPARRNRTAPTATGRTRQRRTARPTGPHPTRTPETRSSRRGQLPPEPGPQEPDLHLPGKTQGHVQSQASNPRPALARVPESSGQEPAPSGSQGPRDGGEHVQAPPALPARAAGQQGRPAPGPSTREEETGQGAVDREGGTPAGGAGHVPLRLAVRRAAVEEQAVRGGRIGIDPR